MFDRPAIWTWDQRMTDKEKFIVATLLEKNQDLEENLNVTIRKTGDFITLYISRGTYMADGNSPTTKEYSLDKNGQIKHKEKMDADDYEVYIKLKGEIESGVKKLNEMYSKLYD